jgi:hypothetical protein
MPRRDSSINTTDSRLPVPRMTRFLLLLVGVVAVAAALGYTIAGLGGLRAGITSSALGGALVILFAALM